MTLTITASELKRFAPKAKAVYVDTLLANLNVLEDAGILENNFRLAHFFAQVGAETDGMTILRESMAYRTPARLRAVWPSRFGKKSDAFLLELIADPVKLADSVYGGRMGNRKGTSDGYDYRGGMWLQTTGRGAVAKYCAKLGAEPLPSSLDDPVLTLQMACLEWEESGCNAWADQNDILKVSKAINTGSATSNIMPVGLPDRKHWLAQALKVWGQARHLAEVADVQPDKLESRTIAAGGLLRKAGATVAAAAVGKGANDVSVPVPTPPAIDLPLSDIASQLTLTQKVMEGLGAVAKFATSNYWIAGLVIGAILWFYGGRIINWYLEDIRTGKRKPVVKGSK